MIPKRIIQTWKTTDIPRRYRAYQRQLRRLHPDYEYLLMTDEEVDSFVRREYPEYAQAFDDLQDFISRIDLFRLLAVHKMGGFYFDLDVCISKPLDDLLDQACIFPFERQMDAYGSALLGTIEMLGQYAFGAQAGHPFLRACADNIRRTTLDSDFARAPSREILDSVLPAIIRDRGFMRVLYTAGPAMITRTLLEQPEGSEDVRILAAHGRNSRRKVKHVFGVYGAHQMSGTWLTHAQFSGLWRLLSRLRLRHKLRLLAKAESHLSRELLTVERLT
ncbi:glycosyltransferase family 32 protein [Elongatibacter sediminis]|uniref:Glycosyltransferase n=1 Tax=Elongatibacter sediminis TaxID=3119006 RepID=A0AAW9R7T4_9GAMM